MVLLSSINLGAKVIKEVDFTVSLIYVLSIVVSKVIWRVRSLLNWDNIKMINNEDFISLWSKNGKRIKKVRYVISMNLVGIICCDWCLNHMNLEVPCINWHLKMMVEFRWSSRALPVPCINRYANRTEACILPSRVLHVPCINRHVKRTVACSWPIRVLYVKSRALLAELITAKLVLIIVNDYYNLIGSEKSRLYEPGLYSWWIERFLCQETLRITK